MSDNQHLAQLNIGRLRYPTDDPRMADFMNNLDLVNGLAERSRGFVWRLRDGSNNATNFRPVDDRARMRESSRNGRGAPSCIKANRQSENSSRKRD